MKKLFFITAVAILLLPAAALAVGPGDIGLGLILGEPTGLSAKLWLDKDVAVDAAVAWSLESTTYFHLHTDYLFHDFDAFDVKKGELAFYYGPGARIKMHKHRKTRVGLRATGGINYIVPKHPIDLFFEIAILVDVIPDTEADFNAGLGMRYYFH
ncbi:MAG: hypothetical protein ABH868_01330 [bacterium]